MVTFNCEVCNETVPKKNTEKHYYRCPNAYYTCIDCSKTFDDGYSYKQHTSCISEDEKYQKSLYRGNKKGANKVKTANNNNNNKNQNNKNENNTPQPEQKREHEQETNAARESDTKKKSKKNNSQKKEKKISKPAIFKDGESLYNCLKSIKDKDEKKKLLKSIILKQNPEEKNSFIISV